LFGRQAPSEEGVGEEDVAVDEAEGAQGNLCVEPEELLHQLETRLDALHAEREDLDDRIVFFIGVDRDLQYRRTVLEVEVAVISVIEVLFGELIEVSLDLTVDLLLTLRMELLGSRSGH
jgi:hypothetical protein